MPQVTLNLLKATVFSGRGHTDQILIYFDGPPQFPVFAFAPTPTPYLKCEVTKGHGKEYCQRVFGLIPEEITETETFFRF